MISVFDLFTIGIGPSSSHTVGPMRAANQFTQFLLAKVAASQVQRVQIELYGSLAATGIGHGTHNAVLAGLEGYMPEKIMPDILIQCVSTIQHNQQLNLAGQHQIHFNLGTDLLWYKREVLPYHANGMRFSAFTTQGKLITAQVYYSVGGGFVVAEADLNAQENRPNDSNDVIFPYPFTSATELFSHCEDNAMSIQEIMLANELKLHSADEINKRLLDIWQAMLDAINYGCKHRGVLPGGLQVKRRAPDLYQKLAQHEKDGLRHDMSWLSLYALAVNEENAMGGRVVTAPTNGAAGIIPAVLNYHMHFDAKAKEADIINFLLTAGAIGSLYKHGASISAAEVGCQGEVGVACSMAAGAYAAVLGGSLNQIENAAEMGMEHHLGLTCDPIGGLVQIPCIERNAAGAVQAVNLARLALLESSKNKISLDQVIATMWQTGKDMSTKYKETAEGGLAVNAPEC